MNKLEERSLSVRKFDLAFDQPSVIGLLEEAARKVTSAYDLTRCEFLSGEQE